MDSFQKHKSPSPDGWTFEFYLGFFNLLDDNLLRVAKKITQNGKVLGSFNTSFISLIPKVEKLNSFEDFRLISSCNFIYNILSKVIAACLKIILSKVISVEQFGFLGGRFIHKGVGYTQEELHTIIWSSFC